MRTKTVRIDKTKHKTQPFTVTELGRVDKVRAERYSTERTATIGAMRACRDFLKQNHMEHNVRILLPQGWERHGIMRADGKFKLLPITNYNVMKRGPKSKSSTTKKKK